jgi:hypothetical protein
MINPDGLHLTDLSYDCLGWLVARGYPLDTLSMGMSDDLEAAIAEGATMVRVGTAIFGPVTAPNWIWRGPTLFRGTSWLTAATLVPPSATINARHATTIAGDGRRPKSFLISAPFPGCLAEARLQRPSEGSCRCAGTSYASLTPRS